MTDNAALDPQSRRMLEKIVDETHGEILKLHQKTLQVHQAQMTNLVDLLWALVERIDHLEKTTGQEADDADRS